MTNKASSAPKGEKPSAPIKPIEKTPTIKESGALDHQTDTAKKGASPATIVLIVLLSVFLVCGLTFGVFALIKSRKPYHVEEFQGETYYIIDKDYNGEYDLQYKNFDDDGLYIYEPVLEYDDETDDEIPELSDVTQEIDSLLSETEKCASYPEGEERQKCITLALDDDYYDDDYDEDEDEDEVEDEDSYDEEEDYEEDYDDDYDGNYPDVTGVYDYETYKDYCDRWGYNQKYTDPNKRYAIFSYVSYGSPSIEARLSHVSFDKDTVVLYVWDDAHGVTADNAGYLIVVPFSDNEIINISIVSLHTQSEFDQIKRGEVRYYPVVDKPIIYLYPEEETKVSVQLGYPNLLTTSYPEYDEGWNVLARPDGTIVNLTTNRELYSLYYESEATAKPELTEGFIVKGEDVAKFLEEKLAILGLTDREAQEFIVYWLPKLEKNRYNLIRFETAEEIAENMPLTVSPAPDTTIRVIMDFKALDEEIEIEEQILEAPTRTGFTVVEWGGSEL